MNVKDIYINLKDRINFKNSKITMYEKFIANYTIRKFFKHY
jgi:hypothetical protein